MRGATVRMLSFALLLLCAGLLVVAGVALWSVPAAFVVGGVLLAGWAVLVFAEVSE